MPSLVGSEMCIRDSAIVGLSSLPRHRLEIAPCPTQKSIDLIEKLERYGFALRILGTRERGQLGWCSPTIPSVTVHQTPKSQHGSSKITLCHEKIWSSALDIPASFGSNTITATPAPTTQLVGVNHVISSGLSPGLDVCLEHACDANLHEDSLMLFCTNSRKVCGRKFWSNTWYTFCFGGTGFSPGLDN